MKTRNFEELQRSQHFRLKRRKAKVDRFHQGLSIYTTELKYKRKVKAVEVKGVANSPMSSTHL